jgi:hypothetical protein
LYAESISRLFWYVRDIAIEPSVQEMSLRLCVSVVKEQCNAFLAPRRMKPIFLMHGNYGSMRRDQWNVGWEHHCKRVCTIQFLAKINLPLRKEIQRLDYLSCTPLCSVLDPDWIRIQLGHWIRIQEGKNDPQK